MTYNDIKRILKEQGMVFSYEVDSNENIIAIYLEDAKPETVVKLSKLMPDYYISNQNWEGIVITKLIKDGFS